MLVGRGAELERIQRLLDQARAGHSSVLVLSGEPGIGKTSLLEAAAQKADGSTVLKASGVESEAELPFSGLLQLLRPILAHVDQLPAPQADALRGVFALDRHAETETDRFATYAATLGLLAAAAERSPVLVLIDDAQWLDAASGEALAFAARRLGSEGVVMLWAVRAGDSPPFSIEGFDEWPLAGLDRVAGGELIERASDSSVSDETAGRLVEATGGNPLALLEIPALLTQRQRAGVERIAQPLPIGPSLEAAFGRRLDRLGAEARMALLIMAVSAVPELVTIERALAVEGLTVEVLDAAQDARVVVTTESGLEFRHPLIRAAAHARATAAERRAAHRALAAALADGPRVDDWAWHRALAVGGPDEGAAAALEAAGDRAKAASWHAAELAFERSARLTPFGEEARGRRLLAAAQAAQMGGRLDAGAALAQEAAVALEGDPALRAETTHLWGRIEAGRGAFRRAARILEDGAALAAATSPERAALMLSDAVIPWGQLGEHDRADSAAQRAWELPWPRGGPTELSVTLMFADVLALRGRFSEAVELWRRVADVPVEDDADALARIAEALFSAGDDEPARMAAERAIARARESSALGVLPVALGVLALIEMRAGKLRTAAAAAAEGSELARALGQLGEYVDGLGRLAWIEALLGRDSECRRHDAEAAELLRQVGYEGPVGGSAVGLLELSLGRPQEAIEELERTVRFRGVRMRGDVLAPRPVLADLIEAYVRAGRLEDARWHLADMCEQAESCAQPLALAAAARCRGLVEGEEQPFVEALAWHEQRPNELERGRTLLCHGELLRRRKRRTDARAELRAALSAFEEVGATIWAERARTELRATGERARRRSPDTRDTLTPQELQVARLVTEGLTNREIAARLFLSPKTIETHLRHAFQKLGVRSRTELAVSFEVGEHGDLRVPPDSSPSPAS